MGALMLTTAGACAEPEPPNLVRKTIGPAGGIISSHDQVLTIVLQPGALTREVDVEIFPSEQPPLIFGPAYRVRPDLELEVDAEVTYRRALPNNADGVAVAGIHLEDYLNEEGYWRALPRLSIDEASNSVLASDSELSLYYGMLESGGSGPTTAGSAGSTGGNSSDPTVGDPTVGDPTVGDPTVGDPTEGDPTEGPNDPTTPTGVGCGDSTAEPGELCLVGADVDMGGGPTDVTLGDFNADGDLDVATSNGAGSFSVRLGDGAGGFGNELNYPAGASASALVAADFDMAMGDDLVVISPDDNELLLLQSLGDGTFNANPVAMMGMAPTEVILADVNDDAIPDIITANVGSTNASVFTFEGGLSGEFVFDTGMVGAPAGLSWGMYNQADDPTYEDLFTFGEGSWSALPGDGFAVSDSPIGGAVGTDLRRAVGGNLGGGGPGDAAVADASEGGVYVLLGDGNAGGFESMSFYPTGAGTVDVTAADVTGDGDLDLIAVNGGADTITILAKTSGSAWDDATDYDVGSEPSGVEIGDLNGDDVLDIVVSNRSGDSITVLLSNP